MRISGCDNCEGQDTLECKHCGQDYDCPECDGNSDRYMNRSELWTSFEGLFEDVTRAIRDDEIAVNEDWNNYTDSERKDNRITNFAYETWTMDECRAAAERAS